MLKRMEADGLVTKTVEQNEGNPQRNVYTITPLGRDKLTSWLSKPIEQVPVRMELLLKLFFAQNAPPDVIIRQLEDIQQKIQSGLQACLRIEEEFLRNEGAKQHEGYIYWLATLRYGISDAKFRIQWCEETIDSIQKSQSEKRK
jgi:DNA-binding PadR family transcriptional regulator